MLIWMLAFFADIRPLYEAYQALISEEKNTIRLIKNHQKESISLKPIQLPKRKSEIERADEITTLALASGLTLKQMTFHSSMLHAAFQGDFGRVVAFLQRFHREEQLPLMGDFSYHAGGKVEMDFLGPSELSSVVKSIENKNVLVFSSPFCNESSSLSMLGATVEKAKHYSIKLMRMVGYLEQGERKLALVQLPDSSLIEVLPNMMLGRERAMVKDINEKQLVVLLSDKSRFLLATEFK